MRNFFQLLDIIGLFASFKTFRSPLLPVTAIKLKGMAYTERHLRPNSKFIGR